MKFVIAFLALNSIASAQCPSGVCPVPAKKYVAPQVYAASSCQAKAKRGLPNIFKIFNIFKHHSH